MDYINNRCQCSLRQIDPIPLIWISNRTALYFNQSTVVIDGEGRPLICHADMIRAVEYTLLTISILASILILLTHVLFKELRTLPSLLLVNLTVALLLGDSSRLMRLIPITSFSYCDTLDILYYSFFVTRFIWMNVMAVELIRIFRSIVHLQLSSGKKWKSLTVYMIIAWGISLVIASILIALHYAIREPEEILLPGDPPPLACGINTPEIALVIAVLLLTTAFNVVAFVIITVYFCKASCNSKIRKTDKRLKDLTRLVVAVFLSLGLVGTIGYFLLFLELALNESTVIITRYFVLPFFQDSQSLLLAAVFLCTSKVAKLYWSLLTCKYHKKSKKRLEKNSTSLSLT